MKKLIYIGIIVTMLLITLLAYFDFVYVLIHVATFIIVLLPSLFMLLIISFIIRMVMIGKGTDKSTSELFRVALKYACPLLMVLTSPIISLSILLFAINSVVFDGIDDIPEVYEIGIVDYIDGFNVDDFGIKMDLPVDEASLMEEQSESTNYYEYYINDKRYIITLGLIEKTDFEILTDSKDWLWSQFNFDSEMINELLLLNSFDLKYELLTMTSSRIPLRLTLNEFVELYTLYLHKHIDMSMGLKYYYNIDELAGFIYDFGDSGYVVEVHGNDAVYQIQLFERITDDKLSSLLSSIEIVKQ